MTLLDRFDVLPSPHEKKQLAGVNFFGGEVTLTNQHHDLISERVFVRRVPIGATRAGEGKKSAAPSNVTDSSRWERTRTRK